jgi:DNA-binding IclR family transcriptional regulator
VTIDLRDDGITGRSGRTVTSRVLSVLDAFTDQRRSLTLSEIGRRAGIPIATTHRLVGELVAWGALERDPSGRYQIGLRLWEVGTLAPRGLGLRDVAMPFLEDLWAATQHHVQLAVLDGTDVVYLERLGGRDAPTVRGRVGGRWPAHTTGAGLVLLAFAGEPVQRRYLSQPLATFTPQTIADGRLLRGTLSGVRQKGFAVSDRQVTTDAVSVAAPVRDGTGEVVAAVAVVVPATHRDPAGLAPAVVTAGRGISRRLSGLRRSG